MRVVIMACGLLLVALLSPGLVAAVPPEPSSSARWDSSIQAAEAELGDFRRSWRKQKDSVDAAALNPVCQAMDLPGRGPIPDVDVLASLDVKSFKVVLLNEVHFQSALLAYPDLLGKMKGLDPRIDCLFMEYSPGYEPRTRAGYPGSFDPLRAVWVAAFDLGLKILFVDGKKSGAPEDAYVSVVRRNPDMAERIASSLDQGTCSAGIMIVGKAHGGSSVGGRPTRSIQSLLSERGIAALSIHVIDLFTASKEGKEPAFAYYDPDAKGIVRVPNQRDHDHSSCLEKGRSFSYGTGFLNRRSGDFCKTPYDAEGWGSLCDFDATLFY